MLDTLRNAWRIEELRKKILFTVLMLLIYRIGSAIAVPGVNVDVIRSAVEGNGILGMLDFMNGGAFSNYSIFAMGIQPYITSSIVMNLLTVAIPALERLQKEGEEGRKKIAQYTRYVTVVLGFIQAIGITMSMGAGALVANGMPSWFSYLTIGISLAAGTAFTMWLGEQITENGIGNGISLIIFIGIIARFPQQLYLGLQAILRDMSLIWVAPVALVGIIALIAVIVFVDEGERRVPVQYAKRVVGRRMFGGQSTHIPLKVNASGVMPLIFAMSILQFPGLIVQFGNWGATGFGIWWSTWMNPRSPVYMAVFALLIVFFAFFYSTIQFNPVEIAKNLQQNGGFIPGIRPGKPTSDYLSRTVSRITLAGALFLAVIATIPSLFFLFTRNASPFTATGILIVVSVALETSKQLEAQMLMRHYKGFMR